MAEGIQANAQNPNLDSIVEISSFQVQANICLSDA